MKRFQLSGRTESEMMIARSRTTGNQAEGLGYVPGTVWRGALASALIREGDLDDQAHTNYVFRSLFLSGTVRFGDLRPPRSAVVPMSTVRCADRDEHRIQDRLLRPTLRMPPLTECADPTAAGKCGAKLEPVEGLAYWTKEWRRDKAVESRNLPKFRLVAHTAIVNERLRAREQQLYVTTVIERGLNLAGEVIATDEASAAALQEAIGKERILTLGRGVTRGQGRIRVTLKEAGPDVGLRRRLEELNDTLAESGRFGFTVTLRSACCVFDEWLRSRAYLTREDIEQAAGEPGALDEYDLENWHSRLATISGWNAQAGLPKTDIVAIARGSTFLFCRKRENLDVEAEIEKLGRVLDKASVGLGEKWEEGYGEAEFCQELHYRRAGGDE